MFLEQEEYIYFIYSDMKFVIILIYVDSWSVGACQFTISQRSYLWTRRRGWQSLQHS